jgi:hypothetical protein
MVGSKPWIGQDENDKQKTVVQNGCDARELSCRPDVQTHLLNRVVELGHVEDSASRQSQKTKPHPAAACSVRAKLQVGSNPPSKNAKLASLLHDSVVGPASMEQ